MVPNDFDLIAAGEPGGTLSDAGSPRIVSRWSPLLSVVEIAVEGLHWRVRNADPGFVRWADLGETLVPEGVAKIDFRRIGFATSSGDIWIDMPNAVTVCALAGVARAEARVSGRERE